MLDYVLYYILLKNMPLPRITAKKLYVLYPQKKIHIYIYIYGKNKCVPLKIYIDKVSINLPYYKYFLTRILKYVILKEQLDCIKQKF